MTDSTFQRILDAAQNGTGSATIRTTTRFNTPPGSNQPVQTNIPLSQQVTRQVTPRTSPLNYVIPDKIDKSSSGSVLRYPYEALTDETDYLQIDIRAYNSPGTLSGGGLVSGRNADGTTRRGTTFNPTGGVKTGDLFTTFDPNKGAKSLGDISKTNFKKAQGTILLPMPSNIQDSNSVSFSQGNLDGITSQIYSDIADKPANYTIPQGMKPMQALLSHFTNAASNLGNTLYNKGDDIANIIAKNLFAQAANIPIGGSLTRDAVFARESGSILNQNVELLFNGATIRSFKFSFKMTPRNNKEAEQIKFIINTFKRQMAAKLAVDNNLFLKTPSVFDLTYKRGASKHPFLHTFKQCVLTDMSVNYTGEGVYSVYNDSTPVSMVLELGFKELEPIYSQDYNEIPIEQGVGY